MKKIIYILLFFASIVSITSCKKTTTASNTTDNLFTEKISNIKRNEPVLLAFTSNYAPAIDWQITPNNNVEINKAGNYATVKFAATGVYTAIAKAGNKQATYIVSVDNILYDAIGTNFSVTASKIVGVNTNEDVLFTVHNAATNNISWSINGFLPSLNLAADKKSAIISFKGGSSATVTVTDGINTQSRTVFINDAASNNSIDTVPFIFGDKLNITPSLSSDKKTLYLSANTNYNYQCNNDKILSVSNATSNNFSVSYGGVVMASNPCTTIASATCINSFSNMIDGVFPFTISYENKTFVGTITVSNNKYTFNFTNNSLINFTLLHVE